jgi:hypothetical protein
VIALSSRVAELEAERAALAGDKDALAATISEQAATISDLKQQLADAQAGGGSSGGDASSKVHVAEGYDFSAASGGDGDQQLDDAALGAAVSSLTSRLAALEASAGGVVAMDDVSKVPEDKLQVGTNLSFSLALPALRALARLHRTHHTRACSRSAYVCAEDYLDCTRMV